MHEFRSVMQQLGGKWQELLGVKSSFDRRVVDKNDLNLYLEAGNHFCTEDLTVSVVDRPGEDYRKPDREVVELNDTQVRIRIQYKNRRLLKDYNREVKLLSEMRPQPPAIAS